MEANTKRPRLALHRALLMGSGGVGKTSLCNSFCFGRYVDTFDSSIDTAYRKEITVENIPYILHIFDKAGQAEHLALREEWIRESTVFALVFSFSSRESFEKTKKLYQQIHSVKHAPVPLILAGNKCDIRPESWQVSVEEARSLAKEFDCEVVQTSAKYDENVEEMFYKLVELAHRLDERIQERPDGPPSRPDVIPNQELGLDIKNTSSEGVRNHSTAENTANITSEIPETASAAIDDINLSRHTDHFDDGIEGQVPKRRYREKLDWRSRFLHFLKRF